MISFSPLGSAYLPTCLHSFLSYFFFPSFLPSSTHTSSSSTTTALFPSPTVEGEPMRTKEEKKNFKGQIITRERTDNERQAEGGAHTYRMHRQALPENFQKTITDGGERRQKNNNINDDVDIVVLPSHVEQSDA